MIHKKLPKLDLNITNRCNFRCIHCAFDSGKTRMRELSLKELKRILVQTKKLGGEKIDITGGEPTLRKDLVQIIKIGKNLGFSIELVTNGSTIGRSDLIRFKKLGLDSIAISLDGANYETYRKIRLVDKKTYIKVKQTIKEAVKLGFKTKINTVVFKSNLDDIENITRFCIKNRIYEYGIYYFTPVGRGNLKKGMSVEPRKWLRYIQTHLMRYKDKIRITLETPIIEKSFKNKDLGCILNSDPYHLQILPDGNTYPCAIMASYNKPIANLKEKSVVEVWNDQRIWKKRCKKIYKNVFKKNKGFCADFGSFRLSDYKKDYKFVCPLRKFEIGELK